MIDGLLGVYSVADRFRTSHLMLLNRDSLAALHILDIDGVTVGEVVCFAATCPNIQKLEMGRICLSDQIPAWIAANGVTFSQWHERGELRSHDLELLLQTSINLTSLEVREQHFDLRDWASAGVDGGDDGEQGEHSTTSSASRTLAPIRRLAFNSTDPSESLPDFVVMGMATLSQLRADLAYLDLSGAFGLTNSACGQLARLTALLELDISGHPGQCSSISDRGLFSLAGGGGEGWKLEALTMRHATRVTERGIGALLTGLPALRALVVSGCERVGAVPGLPTSSEQRLLLERLELAETYTSDDAVCALVAACPHLTVLDVCGCADLTDRVVLAAAAIATARGGAFRSLRAAHCLITDAGLGALARTGVRINEFVCGRARAPAVALIAESAAAAAAAAAPREPESHHARQQKPQGGGGGSDDDDDKYDDPTADSGGLLLPQAAPAVVLCAHVTTVGAEALVYGPCGGAASLTLRSADLNPPGALFSALCAASAPLAELMVLDLGAARGLGAGHVSGAPVAGLGGADAQADAALGRELARVAEQVVQDLKGGGGGRVDQVTGCGSGGGLRVERQGPVRETGAAGVG